MPKYRPIPKRDADLCKQRAISGNHPTYRIREALGIRGDKIPKNMSGTYYVDGRKVRVYRSGESPSGFHRIFIETNKGRMIPVGRLRQHLCKRRGRLRQQIADSRSGALRGSVHSDQTSRRSGRALPLRSVPDQYRR